MIYRINFDFVDCGKVRTGEFTLTGDLPLTPKEAQFIVESLVRVEVNVKSISTSVNNRSV